MTAPTPRATRAESRSLLRVEPGEEARLTPDGPTAAVILSRGVLPLRPRTEGRPPLRATFPGTAVSIGPAEFEVVDSRSTEDGRLYRLTRWPEEQVQRDRIVYDAGFVRSVQRLRELASAQRRARTWSWVLYPFVGLLPENLQLRACDRLGLDAPRATVIGGLSEALAWFLLIALLGRAEPGVGKVFLVASISIALIAPALGRAVGSLLLREVTGTWPLLLVVSLIGGLREERALASWLTRVELLRLVAQPDEIAETDEPGVFAVTSPLPHVGWESSARVLLGDEEWLANALPPRLEAGSLRFSYLLAPSGVPSELTPEAQRGRAAHVYRDTFEADQREQWRELGQSLPWVVSLFSRDEQRRAVAAGADAAALRKGAIFTATCFEIPAALLLLVPGKGHDVGMVAVGLLLAGEAAWRIREARLGRPAPALGGRLVAPFFSPVSRALRAHREALRRTWARLVEKL